MSKIMTMVLIALTNTLYRLAVVIVLSPCIGILERIVCAIFPESEEAAAEQADMDRLETRFLEHPALAIAQSKTVIDSMAEKTLESVTGVISARQNYSKEEVRKVIELERVIDRYEDKLGSYLFKITQNHPDPGQSNEINKYLRVLSDFERMSDHARNIGEAIEEISDKKIIFTKAADDGLKVLESAIKDITEVTLAAFRENDADMALKIDPLEEVIDDLCDELKAGHIERVGKGECTLENGFVFNDLLTDYERIADHCSNVAVDLLESEKDEFKSHEYHKSLEYRQNPVFNDNFNWYKNKYTISNH